MTYKEWDEINLIRIRGKLTDEFLHTLIDVVIACGNSADMIETVELVNWCHRESDKPIPLKGTWNIPTFDDDGK